MTRPDLAWTLTWHRQGTAPGWSPLRMAATQASGVWAWCLPGWYAVDRDDVPRVVGGAICQCTCRHGCGRAITHVGAMPGHVSAMSTHVSAMSVSCRCCVGAMSVTCQRQVSAMSVGICHVRVMSLSVHCSAMSHRRVSAMSQCHVGTMAVQWQCNVGTRCQ